MPSILLINDNKIVSRLLQLSSQKHNYQLEEIKDYNPAENAYNVVFIDSDKYDETAWEALKENLTFDRLGYIADKNAAQPEGFDFVLEKPFLPTDFVNLMSENFKVMSPDEMDLDEIEDIGEDDDMLDLDNLDALEIDEPLEEDDQLDTLEEMDLETDDEVIADDTALKTGIAETMHVADASKEDLAGMVDEIDNMELEEMDLDALADESEENVEDPSVVNEALVKESLDEVESSVDEEEISGDEEELPKEQNIDEAPLAAAAGAASIATAALAADTVADRVEEEQEELKESLNILDGVETIEEEDDYLVPTEKKVEQLADEFDSLNEEEVKKIMSAEPESEDIISEEIVTEGEEKVVQPDDLEHMITEAVSKAITKKMLQEALDDMEIVVTLKTKKSDNS